MSKFLRICAMAPRQGARDGRGRRCQRGAETVELAVTLAFFMLVLFSFLIGIFLMYDYNAIAYLAREGVYYAVRRGAEADAATSPCPHRRPRRRRPPLRLIFARTACFHPRR